eukprot:2748024-Pleurochrysis_carterae.AAC.1
MKLCPLRFDKLVASYDMALLSCDARRWTCAKKVTSNRQWTWFHKLRRTEQEHENPPSQLYRNGQRETARAQRARLSPYYSDNYLLGRSCQSTARSGVAHSTKLRIRSSHARSVAWLAHTNEATS